METPLLQTKLYTPPIRPEQVLRPRLVELINAALHQKLTFLSAPAGFGKTTLLSEWAIEAGRPVIWVGLNEADNDPTRFFAYLIGALQSIDEQIGRAVHMLLQAPRVPPAKSLMTTLVNEIAATSTPFALVFDDFHFLVELSLLEAIRFLLEHQPPHMHLVIATRKDPPLPLARLRAQEQMTELRVDDLRFSRQEIDLFLNDIMGLALASDDAAALETRTEGWIAGLQLAAFSLQRYITQASRSDFVQTFAGDDRHIMDYLVGEVFCQQTEEVQSFLLHSSILGRLCGPLCDVVVYEGESRGRSQQILEQIDQANLFMVPLDNRREWYRYHHLFADLLRHRLQRLQPQIVPQLHLRASAWYVDAGHLDEAIQHALTAQDYERAAALIEPLATQLVTEGRLSTALGWLAKLPDELVRARPQLGIAAARANLLSGKIDVIEPLLQAVEACMVELPPENLADTDQLRGQVFVIRAFIARWQGDLQCSLRLSHQAYEHLPAESNALHSSLALNLGNVHRTLGDLATAQTYYEDVVTINRQTDCNYYGALMALSNLAEIENQMGHLHRSAEILRQSIHLGTEKGGGRPYPAMGVAFVDMANLLYEWNRLDEAAVHAAHGIELAQQADDVFIIIQGYVVLARLQYAQNDFDAATETLERAREMRARASRREEAGLISGTQVRLWLAQNNLAAAARWANEKADYLGDELNLLNRRDHFTMVRILIAQDKPDDALDRLVRLLDAAEHDPETYYQILIKGRLGERWADWFEGMAITHNAQGDTVLTGPIADQSELQGILSTIGTLNMTLISVAQIDVKSFTEPHSNQDADTLSD